MAALEIKFRLEFTGTKVMFDYFKNDTFEWSGDSV